MLLIPPQLWQAIQRWLAVSGQPVDTGERPNLSETLVPVVDVTALVRANDRLNFSDSASSAATGEVNIVTVPEGEDWDLDTISGVRGAGTLQTFDYYFLVRTGVTARVAMFTAVGNDARLMPLHLKAGDILGVNVAVAEAGSTIALRGCYVRIQRRAPVSA